MGDGRGTAFKGEVTPVSRAFFVGFVRVCKGFGAPRRRAGAAVVLGLFAASVAIVSGGVVTEATPATQLLRYPYLTDDSSSHATVELATNAQTSVKLTYGLSPNCTGASVSASGSPITVNGVHEYQFKLHLAGLAAGQTYCYGITQSTVNLLGSDPKPSFKSALAAGDTSSFKFAVIGDWGNTAKGANNPQEAALMSSIHNSGASLALTTGDISYSGGSQTNYGDLNQQGTNISNVFPMQYWGQNGASIPMFATTGDHGFTTPGTHFLNWDATATAADSGGKYLSEIYSGKDGTSSASYPSIWYAFNWGQARFYVLTAVWGYSNVGNATQYQDDYDYHWAASQPEVTWLQNDLAGPGASAKAKFAVMYFPFHTDNNSQQSDPFLNSGTNNLEGILANNHFTAAFTGHAHIYERNRPVVGSMATYVTGGGGGDLEPVTSCSSFDAFALGWSPTNGIGSSCGTPIPTSQNQVNEYLLVTVSGNTVTVAPTNANNQQFDVVNYPIGVVTGQATSFSVTAPASTPAGSPFSVTLTAQDGNGNTATSYTGTHSLTFSGLANSPNGTAPTYANSANFANGVATGVPITAVDAQTASLGVTDGAISGSSANITITPLAAVKFNLSNPGKQSVGVPFQVTATAVDSLGNTATSYTGPSAPAAAPATGSGPPAFVQEAGATETAAAASLQTNISTTGGNLLVACMSMYTGTTVSTTAITDSGGNTWRPMPTGNPMLVSGHSSRGELWYTLSTSSDTFVKANFSGSVSAAMSVLEFSGVGSVDVSAGAANSGSSASSGATSTLSGSGELAVGFAGTHGSNNAITGAAGGYTTTTQHNTAITSALVSVLSAYKVGAGTAPETFTATTPGAWWAAGVIAFKPGGGGGGGGGTLTWGGLHPSPNNTAPAYPSTTAFSGGVAQVSLTDFNAETTSVTLTDGAINGTNPTPFTVNAGVPAGLTLSAPNPATPAAGSSFSETITAIDAYGNTAPSYVPPASGSGTTGTISYVQEVGATEAALAANLRAGIATAGGDLLVACIGMYTGATISVSSITDSGGNVWQPMPTGNPMLVSGHSSRGELWYSITTTADAWVQANFSANVSAAMSVVEFSGVAAVDKSAGADNIGTSASSGATSTLSSTGELAVGFVAIHASTSAITSTATGYTALTQRNTTTTNASVAVRSAYKLNAGTAAETYTATTPNQYWASGVITFTPKTGGGTGSALHWSGLGTAPNGAAPVYPTTTPVFTNGQATATFTDYDAQTTILAVDDGTLTGQSPSFTVAAGPTASVSLTGVPPQVNSGDTNTATVTAYDQWLNVSAGDNNTLSVTYSPGDTSSCPSAGTCDSSVTLTAGQGTFHFRFILPGQQTITVTEGTLLPASAQTLVV